MKYRVMQQLNYCYFGNNLVAAIEQFDRFAKGALIEQDIHEATREPMLLALAPDTGDLLGVLYGATDQEYANVTAPDPNAHP